MDDVFRSVSKTIIDSLGDSFTYIYSNGERVTIKAVFDYAYVEAFDAASREPVLTIPTEYITPRVGDQVIIDSTLFKIVIVEPDGVGVNVCRLVLA